MSFSKAHRFNGEEILDEDEAESRELDMLVNKMENLLEPAPTPIAWGEGA